MIQVGTIVKVCDKSGVGKSKGPRSFWLNNWEVTVNQYRDLFYYLRNIETNLPNNST